MFKRTFNIPMYTGRIGVIFAENMKQVADEYKINTNHPDCLDGVCFKDGSTYFVAYEAKYLTPSVAAHEAKHLVNWVFHDLGVQLDPHNDEPECYFLGWVMDRVYEVYEKYEDS